MSHPLPNILYIDNRVRTFVYGLEKSIVVDNTPWMNIMLSGSLEYILNDSPIILKEGNIAFFKPGDFVGRRPQNTNVRYLSMRFDSNGVVYNLDPIIPIKHDKIYNLISLLTAYYFDCGTEQPMNECCNSILFCLLTELKNICREKDSNMRLAQIKEYVYRNYMHDISTSNIADFLFLNPSYCNTLYINKQERLLVISLPE